jgi:hypothetical protein
MRAADGPGQEAPAGARSHRANTAKDGWREANPEYLGVYSRLVHNLE